MIEETNFLFLNLHSFFLALINLEYRKGKEVCCGGDSWRGMGALCILSTVQEMPMC